MNKTKRYAFFFWLAIGLILILNLLLWLYLNQVEERFTFNLKTRLLIENRSITRTVNEEYLTSIIPGQTNSLEYISVSQTLDDIRRQDSLQSILILTTEGEILVASPEIIGLQKESIRSDNEFFTRALKGNFITSDIQETGSEKFMSSYGPITDIYGKIIGVQIVEAKATYFTTVEKLRNRLLLFSIINLIVISIIAVFLFRIMNKAVEYQSTIKDHEHLVQLGTMGASVAHEIRNPLAIIEGSNELIRKKYGKKTKDEIFDYIPNETKRLSKIIDHFLAFARTPTINSKTFKLNQMISRLKIGILNTKHINIEFNSFDENITLVSDESLIEQAILNILSNAVDATDEYGSIKIIINETKQNVNIVINNSGPVISPDIKEQIFQPFFTTKEKGTGLGLAITKRSIELLKGKITVESNPETGTSFTIILPKRYKAT